MSNTLFYGDNLSILQQHVLDASVDLVYLDPPFNSNRDYNVLFREQSGRESPAQIKAFGDTWNWAGAAEAWADFAALCPVPKVIELMRGFHNTLGENDVMAYLVMMAPRLYHLWRVLKPTGSLYLHCDPTASHYLKLILDGIFGAKNFKNEIIWKRSYGHGDSRKSLGRSHDVIYLYTKTDIYTLNRFFHSHAAKYLEDFFRHNDERGRYKLENLTSPSPRPNLTYEYNGYPPPAKGWRVNLARMQELHADNRLHFPAKKDGRIMKKVYLHELEGQPMTDLWTDIHPISAHDAERLGYPTQKPIALLERIINASSNPGDVVLDPFCLTGDTLITTRGGLRPIRDVQEGDEVLTHEGRYRRVIRCYRRPYQGQMLTLFRSKSNIGIEITPNHPVLAVRAAACPHENRRCLPRSCRYHTSGRHLDCINPKSDYKLEWIEAGELQEGDWVYFPQTHSADAPITLPLPQTGHFNAIPLPQSVPVAPDLMEWIGYFAAEGFVDSNSVHFTNYEDAERIAELGCRLFGLTATVTQRPYLCKHIRFNSGALSRWMETMIGRGASQKTLPEWVHGLSAPCRQGLLCGLLRGDGSFRKDKIDDLSHSYRYSSSSPTLAHQLYRLLLAEGVACGYSIVKLNRAPRTINGHVCQVNHDAHQVHVYDITSMNHLLQATQEAPIYGETITRKPYDTYPFENGWLYTLRKIERAEDVDTDVFNIEVEEDHSYVTATMAVHNCGCGTAIVAAQKLGRQWLGIDVTPIATSLIQKRLFDQFEARDIRLLSAADKANAVTLARAFNVEGLPTDEAGARAMFEADHKKFEMWAVGLVPAIPQEKKGADGGIDGLAYFDVGAKELTKVVIQVKGGKNVGSPGVQQLRGAMSGLSAALGFYVTLEAPTRNMKAEALSAGYYKAATGVGRQVPAMQIRTVAELLAGHSFEFPVTVGSNVSFKSASAIAAASGQAGLDL